MPTIVQTQQGIVTGLWGGNALIRGSDGVMRVLKMGDVVRKGDVILTTQDGIVRLTQEGEVAAPSVAQRVLASETDRVISALEQNQADAATAAGLTGGADGSNLGEGLRVGRVNESTSGTESGVPTNQIAGSAAGGALTTPNTPPTANSGSVTGNEDSTLPISLIGSDSDGSVVSVRIISVPTGGTLLINGAPVGAGAVLTPEQAANLQFQPNPNLNGNPGPVTFAVTDDRGAESSTGTVNILLLPVPDAPVSSADFASTPEDTALTLAPAALLVNDVDVDGDPLTIVSVQNPSNGTVALVGGNVVFTPPPNYFGPASFTYTVSDGTGRFSTSTVFITVTPVNDGPLANDDAGTTRLNTPIAFQPSELLFNDTDIDGGALSIVSVQNPVNGSVNLVNGTPVFEPAPGYVGPASFTYTISDGNGGTSTATVNITVTAPPPPPPPPPPPATNGLSIDDVTVNEGAGTATFTVTLAPAATSVVTVNFTTSSGTATSGADFSAVTGVLTFPVGVTTQTITVPITNDLIAEGTETFTVTLTGAVNASIADGTGIGTIIDNDGVPTIASVSSPTVVEGNNLVYTVAVSGTSTTNTTFPFTLGGGSAAVGDYGTPTFSNGVTLVGPNLIIPPGVTSFSVTLPTVNDTVAEPNETVPLVIGGVTGTGTITDNDSGPTIATVSSPTVVEGNDLVYAVTVTGTSSTATSVPFTLGGGSAAVGDYGTPTFSNGVTLVGPNLVIPPGVTSFNVTLPTVNDTVFEPNETVPLNIGGVTGTGTITDNDSAPTIATVSSPTVVEGNDLVYAVTVTGTSSTATSVPFTLGGGSAAVGDYGTPTFSNGVTLVGPNLVIPPGVTSFNVTLPTVNDTVAEPNETVPLVIGGVTGTGTITDNDSGPTIATVSSPTVVEGNDLVYAVTVTGTSSTATSVPFTLGGGSAAVGDYGTPTFSNGVTLVGPNLIIPPGVTSFNVTLPTVNDAVFEPNETVPLNIGGVTGTGTITDNDSAPTIATVSSPTVVEGVDLVYAVTVTGTSSTATSVPFTLGGGSAAVGDYGTPTFSNGVTLVGPNLVIPPGVTSFNVTLPTVNDTVFEPNETVPLNIGGVTGTGTITDNDSAPTIATVSSPTVVEGNDLVYAVTVTGTSSTATSVPFTLGGGSAAVGDYGTPTFSNGVTLVGPNLVIPPGVTSFNVTLPTVNDTVAEPNETVPLVIGGVTGTGTITDNDSGPTIATVSSPTVVEGNDLVYAVTVTGTSSTATSVPFTLGGGSAAVGDYGTPTFSNGVTLVGPNLVIPPGVTSFSVTLPTVNDAVFEPNETVPLNIGGVTGTGTITDNDSAPTIATVSSPTVVEGVDLVYAVTVTGTSSTATSVPFTLGGGSAAVGDYGTPTFSNGVTLVGPNLVIPPGVTSFNVTLPTVNDTVFEPNETVPLNIGGVTGTGTITDNDSAPTIATVSSPTVVEGNDLVYAVTVTGTSSTATSVPFTLGGGSAAVGDYGTPTFSNGVTLVGPNLVIPPGVTSFNVTLPTVNDTVFEPNETVPLNIGGVTGTGTITDNDSAPTIATVSSPTVVEGNDLVYAVTVTGTSSTATSVPFTLGGGSAAVGDYGTPTFSNGVTLVGPNLVIPPGVTSFSVTLPTVNDAVFEPNETVPLNIGGVTGTGTITDNDSAPTIATISSPTVVEGVDLVYAVTVTGTSSTATSVPFTLGGGSAAVGDYGTPTFNNGVTLVGPNLIIPPGVTSFNVTLPTVNDTLNESNETVPLVIGGVTGTGTILDNDARNVTKVTLEDTPATFTAADFGLIAGDTGVRIDTLTPGAGQLLLNGLAVSAGTVVSVADINAGLLTYSPAGNGPTSTNLSGNNYASFTFSVRDASNVFDLVPNNVRIDVTPDADTPTINVAPATVTPPLPASQGLTWLFVANLPGADSSNAGNTAVVESAIDAAGGASTLVTNVFLSGNSFPSGIGGPPGLGSEAGGQNDPTITNTDNAHQFTGFVFLEAGQTATFSGFRDDTMRIELGGSTVFDQGFNTWGPFSSSGFTASATGFYSVEIVYYNGDGPGGLNVNFSNGVTTGDLSTSNFVLLPDAAAVTALGSSVVGSLVPNGEPGAGYYPAIFTSSTWVDLATTVNFPDNDGSETRNITVTGLPAGFELRDGVNTVTSTGAAINITTWNLANLEARPATGYTGTATLTFTATATEQGNSDTASSTDTVTLTVTPTTVSALDTALSGPVIAKMDGDALNDSSTTIKTDVFEWHLSDSAASGHGPNIDVINDFQVQADSLDLRDLLVGESHLGQDLGNLANFLSVNVVGSDTEIRISSTGGFQDGQYNSAAEDQRIVLDNVDLVASLSLTPESSNHDIIAAMLNNGKLITD